MLKSIPYLPVYNVHFFPKIYSSKFALRIIHGTFCLLIIYTATLICKHTRKNNKHGNEKNRVTVVLARAGDGSKLKPLIIFKCKTMSKQTWRHSCCPKKGLDGHQNHENLDWKSLVLSNWRSESAKKYTCVGFLCSTQDRASETFTEIKNTDLESLPADQH